MSITTILNTAFSGLRANAQQANASANNIVNQNTPGYRPVTANGVSPVAGGAGAGVQAQLLAQDGPVDVTREFTKVIVAETAYKANAQVIRAADQLADETVDLIG
ncbi:MAG: flagellar basal body rod C-terminal domain-containing protein [Rhodospirillaceae bacterium]